MGQAYAFNFPKFFTFFVIYLRLHVTKCTKAVEFVRWTVNSLSFAIHPERRLQLILDSLFRLSRTSD